MSTAWYYLVNNQQQGPVDEASMQQLMQSNIVNAKTLVWQQGMEKWVALQDTPLQAIVPVSAAPLAVPPAPPPAYQARPTQADAESINQLFTWAWILLVASIPLSFIAIGIFTAIASAIIFYVLLYRCWGLVQDGTAQTTPGKAVGFSFIPFFNWYWIFIAFRGLAQDMNRYCRTRGIQAPAVSEDLALWFCILSLCNYIPYLNFVTGIAVCIIMVILFSQYKNTAVAIINSRA